MNFIEKLLKIVAPHECLGCGSEGSVLCRACSVQLNRPQMKCYRCGCLADDSLICGVCAEACALGSVWSTAYYEGLAKNVVHKLKFERASAAADDIAHAIVTSIPCHDWLVTYVPTASVRVRQRGYDQAKIIAKGVAQYLGCEHASLFLRQGSQRQLGQGRTERKNQVKTAFILKSGPSLKNKRILIIDDVLTTGATIEACAGILKNAGASSIDAAVFALADASATTGSLATSFLV